MARRARVGIVWRPWPGALGRRPRRLSLRRFGVFATTAEESETRLAQQTKTSSITLNPAMMTSSSVLSSSRCGGGGGGGGAGKPRSRLPQGIGWSANMSNCMSIEPVSNSLSRIALSKRLAVLACAKPTGQGAKSHGAILVGRNVGCAPELLEEGE